MVGAGGLGGRQAEGRKASKQTRKEGSKQARQAGAGKEGGNWVARELAKSGAEGGSEVS